MLQSRGESSWLLVAGGWLQLCPGQQQAALHWAGHWWLVAMVTVRPAHSAHNSAHCQHGNSQIRYFYTVQYNFGSIRTCLQAHYLGDPVFSMFQLFHSLSSSVLMQIFSNFNFE